jgi:hypothetical protein
MGGGSSTADVYARMTRTVQGGKRALTYSRSAVLPRVSNQQKMR